MSLKYALFDLDLFSRDGRPPDEIGRAESEEDLLWLMEALTRRNVHFLQQRERDGNPAPLLYQSGVKYELPQQAMGDPIEVADLRAALPFLPAAQRRKASRALDKIAQMIGGEHMRDYSQLLQQGAGDCFPLSQKVIVRSRSTKQYEILSLGELRFVYDAYEALSYNFDKKRYEFRRIVAFYDKGTKPVFKARLSNGTDLVSTGDHKFWSLEGGSRPNVEKIVERTMKEYAADYENFAKGTITKNERGSRSRILQAAKIPALDSVKATAAEAYLAGIYAAEGECSDGAHTRIGQHKSSVRAKIEAALEATGSDFSYQPGRGATPGSGAQYSVFGGKLNPIVAMMRSQGTNSFDKHVPQALLSTNQETVARMLEGHGDGDAWRPANGAFKRPNIDAIYATSSDRLMEQLRLGLLITGRSAYAYRYENHMGEGSRPIWRLHEYNDAATKLRARREKLDEVLPGLTYGTVRNVVAAGEEHVGCIEVEGNHNFFLADGTLVHNCDNMAAARAAEIRYYLGVEAMPFLSIGRPNGDGSGVTYHALVIWPDGSSEDPSILLGMGGQARSIDRFFEALKNKERRRMLHSGELVKQWGVEPAVSGLRPFVNEFAARRGASPSFNYQQDDSEVA